jgi:nucleotide-binding universal stress UspA family protein
LPCKWLRAEESTLPRRFIHFRSINVSQLSRILAAIDFSEPARGAFRHALELSRPRNAQLTVVHAIPREEPFAQRARERETLFAELRQQADVARVRLSVIVQHGDPAGVILLHADQKRPDLIVLGTHQRKGLDRLRIGSIAETVTLRAKQPVFVVPVDPESGHAKPVASLDSIVAAVDLTPSSEAVVQEALSLAAGTKARVTLVHAVEEAPPGAVSRYVVPEYRMQLAHEAWARLQSAVPPGKTSAAVHARVVTGSPEIEIVELAKEIDADVIVVGVPARGALTQRLFGTTATRVMRMAERPVLAVPERVQRAAALQAAA